MKIKKVNVENVDGVKIAFVEIENGNLIYSEDTENVFFEKALGNNEYENFIIVKDKNIIAKRNEFLSMK